MRHLLLTYILLFALVAKAQLVDNFDSNTFPDEPTWTGDTDDFRVNENGELQLDAADGGTSTLFSAVSFPEDTVTVRLSFRLDFDPSGSNQLRVYYLLDGTDPALANGYYFELGQTGSDDALTFYHTASGEATQIASGSMGAVASEPAVNMLITLYPSGLQTVEVAYDGGSFLVEDAIINDNSFAISESNYFGLSCSYTASRADLFFFDNIAVDLFEEDRQAPEVLSVSVTSPTTILATFDEPLDMATAENTSNYRIGSTTPSTATAGTNPTEVTLAFAQPFSSRSSFDIAIEGIADINGNTMSAASVWELNYARKPMVGDIVINEILFASEGGSEDFVELYNTTEDFIDLSGAYLGNSTKTNGQLTLIEEGILIAPTGYAVFTQDKELLIENHENTNAAVTYEQDTPDYNNSDGNVLLADELEAVLDSYDYDEDHHYELLGDVKGVSLERISPVLDSNDPETWTSASSAVGFATPGGVNSASIPNVEIEEQFEFVEKVFSPNGDGDKELMVLGYSLEKSGYVANIDIRDVGGFLIKSLKNNETLSASGLITWDGIDESGKLANIGMYIIIGEAFHLDGDVVPLKKVCVLAGDL